MNNLKFTIAAVERDTGLSKDVLRMWERRYGFPTPERDVHGERLYSAEQVDRLRLIKRLMDQGHRPGKLIAAPVGDLAGLASRREVRGAGRASAAASGETGGAAESAASLAAEAAAEAFAELLAAICRHDGAGFRQAMQLRLARQGLQRFVQDTVAPLTEQVGQAWEQGRLQVFEEHLFTEQTKRLLRQAIAALPGATRPPRVLLTSVPEEQHVLGLLMVEALLALEDVECVALGTQMPLLEIVDAAVAHRADIVALSFSVAFPKRQTSPLLRQLRQMLPPEVALWAGGAGVAGLAGIDGVERFVDLPAAVTAIQRWRVTRAATAES